MIIYEISRLHDHFYNSTLCYLQLSCDARDTTWSIRNYVNKSHFQAKIGRKKKWKKKRLMLLGRMVEGPHLFTTDCITSSKYSDSKLIDRCRRTYVGLLVDHETIIWIFISSIRIDSTWFSYFQDFYLHIHVYVNWKAQDAKISFHNYFSLEI